MLYYGAHIWKTGTTREQVGRHLIEEADAGRLRLEGVRGSYGLVGGGAGFLLVEADDPTEVNRALTPSMHLMRWDVRALIPFDLAKDVETFRQELGQGG